jgi:hypothetical protein
VTPHIQNWNCLWAKYTWQVMAIPWTNTMSKINSGNSNNWSPKVSCGLWAILGSFRHSWKNNFSGEKLNVKNKGNNCRILKLSYWKLTSKTFNPSFFGIYNIIAFKDQSFIFGIISYIEVLPPPASWKLSAIWESSQLLEVTSKSSWPYMAQFLAIDV